MKNIQHKSTNDAIDNRMGISNRQNKVPKPNLLAGSLAGKYAVVLNDGRTVIYITDKSKESEIRARYELKKIEIEEIVPVEI